MENKLIKPTIYLLKDIYKNPPNHKIYLFNYIILCFFVYLLAIENISML